MHKNRRISLSGVVLALVTFIAGLALPAALPASAAGDPGWINWVGPSGDDAEAWVRAFGSFGNTMYAGTEGDGIFRSTNFGVTWSKFSTNLPTDSDSVRDIDASATDVIISTDGGLWKSTGGAAWQPLGQGDGADKLNASVQTLFKPSAGPWLAGVVGGVFKSSDSGATWTLSSNGLPVGTTVWGIDGYSYLPGYVFAATSNGAYVSLNGGGSWSSITNGLPTNSNILRILADESNPGTWYAISSGEGVYRTQTGGLLWEPVNNNLPTKQIRSILLLPIAPTKTDIVIGTNTGVFSSIDKGDTWQTISNDGLGFHTSVWALSTIPGVSLALTAGAQGGGVSYRIMAPPVNTAAPAVTTGTLHVGDTITTTKGTWIGTETIAYTYQWQRCTGIDTGCSDIDDATQTTYTLVSADKDSRIRSVVTAKNAVSIPASLTKKESVTTGVILVNPNELPGANTKNNPTISGDDGTIFPGDVLTANHNTWNPVPDSYQYQWFRCTTTSSSSCSPIGGFAASATYTIKTTDAGSHIAARTRGVSVDGSVLSDMGPTTGEILPLQVKSTSSPAIVGKAWVGQKLVRGIGSYSGPIETAYTSWKICSDAAATSCFTTKAGHIDQDGIGDLKLDSGHLGKYIKVTVEVDVNDASAPAPFTVSSKVIGPVKKAPPKVTNSVKPTIKGTAAKGKDLSISTGTWTGSPTFGYRWLRCNKDGGACKLISGATKKTYTLVKADVGHKMRARVTGVNAWALPLTVQTAPTKAVAN